MTRTTGFLLLAFIGTSLLSSCSDTSDTKRDENGNVSSIPWNRPEKWENGSAMPGGMTGTQ